MVQRRTNIEGAARANASGDRTAPLSHPVDAECPDCHGEEGTEDYALPDGSHATRPDACETCGGEGTVMERVWRASVELRLTLRVCGVDKRAAMEEAEEEAQRLAATLLLLRHVEPGVDAEAVDAEPVETYPELIGRLVR